MRLWARPPIQVVIGVILAIVRNFQLFCLILFSPPVAPLSIETNHFCSLLQALAFQFTPRIAWYSGLISGSR